MLAGQHGHTLAFTTLLEGGASLTLKDKVIARHGSLPDVSCGSQWRATGSEGMRIITVGECSFTFT